MSLHIIGCGGHGKVVKEAAEFYKEHFANIDVYDDRIEHKHIKCVPREKGKSICAIGDNSTRKRIVEFLGVDEWHTVIHPTTIISPSASI